jgi:hypothetical protein
LLGQKPFGLPDGTLWNYFYVLSQWVRGKIFCLCGVSSVTNDLQSGRKRPDYGTQGAIRTPECAVCGRIGGGARGINSGTIWTMGMHSVIPYFLTKTKSARMLAKKTSKNQITLPKAIVADFAGVDYFEVSSENGRIMLKPVRTRQAEEVRDKLAALGIRDGDVDAAIRHARGTPD